MANEIEQKVSDDMKYIDQLSEVIHLQIIDLRHQADNHRQAAAYANVKADTLNSAANELESRLCRWAEKSPKTSKYQDRNHSVQR